MAKTKTMDGNQAAAYASYAFTEVATVYPITPSTPMAEAVDEWSAEGKKIYLVNRLKLLKWNLKQVLQVQFMVHLQQEL